MAEVIWSETALSDLDTIAEYIALDKSSAASKLIQLTLSEVELLGTFPNMGKVPSELPQNTPYRELVVKPCRIFYRQTQGQILIIHIMRSEQLFRLNKLD